MMCDGDRQAHTWQADDGRDPGRRGFSGPPRHCARLRRADGAGRMSADERPRNGLGAFAAVQVKPQRLPVGDREAV